MRTKTAPTTTERNYATAWEDYQTGHIVSQHAARTIRNFLSTQMAGSQEAYDDEHVPGDEPSKWYPVDTQFVTTEVIEKDSPAKHTLVRAQQAWETKRIPHPA